ncbi:MAG: molecular chaperone HtpG [Bacteroidetes bacterium GWC2_33_15]|nr:MAG: molecular chaperone HtpG [Bacteroidetes bacterium GWA2_33_15]OFX51014.1 MAG: molecular chaperone HtpG [Bacteroidetes bacterium GWC2_33_15]OFX65637.1 MAG: molecular chaperone HtpG [Bacteroidetes bacterium GWB2_32_14]OFX70222.1 MAG: molecular chaperone HtpG [Bacteroidetes bacterium GWD2_33_33]HAN17217.1 molecular chaperone HtpG [Bacteroidales bacterium]
MSQKTGSKKVCTFQAETKELLNLMINSLYTHREIFLRELISNASDAIDKIHFQSLTDHELLGDDVELKIEIEVDKQNKTLIISDNGIGMTYDEVIENIGTIAKSGTKAFAGRLKESDKIDLIGKFGVGFYSSFMVAKNVEIITRSAKAEKGVKWVSEGDGSYTIEEFDTNTRGTKITLFLRDDATDSSNPEEDFSNQYTIQNLIKKYSNYISYPIHMDFYREETPRDKDGKTIEGAEPETIIDNKVLNSITPIWKKDKKEITNDEYFQFYKHHFHDWNEFADVIHLNLEGKIEFTALLFIPSKASSDLYDRDFSKGIHLYSNNVFIMNDCKDILPEHLRFVRGLLDSPDFSLNISREILQHDAQLKVIGKTLEKKIIEALKKLLKENREKYEEIWPEFGKALKGGIYMEYKNKEKLEDLLLFYSSGNDKMTTLNEYIERMPEGQKEIYYAAAKDINTIKRMPQLEIFKEKNIDVLYFVDKIDEFLTQNLDKYKDIKLQSVTREDFNLDGVLKKNENIEPNEKAEDDKNIEYKDLLDAIKKQLDGKVSDVKMSKRLKSSPVCFVNSNSGASFNMEQLLKGVNQFAPKATKILEINPKHSIFPIIEKVYKNRNANNELKNISEILYNQALLIEGFELENPVDFSNSLCELITKAYN